MVSQAPTEQDSGWFFPSPTNLTTGEQWSSHHPVNIKIFVFLFITTVVGFGTHVALWNSSAEFVNLLFVFHLDTDRVARVQLTIWTLAFCCF